MAEPLVVNARITIPASEIEWTAVRASGPGGQNVNKVSSKVVLRFDLAGTTVLSPSQKTRAAALAPLIDAEGKIVIVAQTTRDQPKNLADARARLRDIVLRALVVPKRRRATKPTRASKERRLSEKKRNSDTKRARRGGDD